MQVFGPVVEPSAQLAVTAAIYVLQRGTVGHRRIRHDDPGSSVLLHRFPSEFQCSFFDRVTRPEFFAAIRPRDRQPAEGGE